MVDGKGTLLAEENHGADSGTKQILLVEDDRFLRRACETKLRQLGFTVVTADNGEAGLIAARTARPDLMLLDLKMPRMSGIDVLHALRADPGLRTLPVLALSNSSREQDVAEVTTLGIVDYWVKANMSLRELGDRVTPFLAPRS
jgi:two-component system, OmpR family, phosphate regulon response regulator PhoB